MEEIDFTIFIKNVRALRVIKGYSSNELSKLAGFKQVKRVADFETYRGKPTLQEVVALSKALGVSVDDLLFKEATVLVKFE
jgi:transcriptional regulator with XRE-family HTH domain